MLTMSFLMTANRIVGFNSWVGTSCEILEMEKVRKRRRGTIIKSVTCRWEWEGKWFESSTMRLPGFFGESPEPGRELARVPQHGSNNSGPDLKKSRCFVNPRNPAEAVFFREMHGSAGVVYLIGMTGLPYPGLLMMLSVFVAHPQQVKDRAARERNPDVPYFWRDDWERGVVEDRSQSNRVIAQYALFWTCPGAAVIGAMLLFTEGGGVAEIVFAGIAGLVAVGAGGLGYFFRPSQFDRLVFVPASFPPCAGYVLQGTVKLPRRLRKRASVSGAVTVTRLLQTSKDGLRPVPLAIEFAAVTIDGRELTVTVPLPDAPPASPHGSHLPVVWTLILTASGESLKSFFELPVAQAA